MSEHMNGGPFTIGPKGIVFIEYWWGSGDDRHLAVGRAHPVHDTPPWDLPASLKSFDQRALYSPEGVRRYWYGFTVENELTNGKTFDVYAATP